MDLVRQQDPHPRADEVAPARAVEQAQGVRSLAPRRDSRGVAPASGRQRGGRQPHIPPREFLEQSELPAEVGHPDPEEAEGRPPQVLRFGGPRTGRAWAHTNACPFVSVPKTAANTRGASTAVIFPTPSATPKPVARYCVGNSSDVYGYTAPQAPRLKKLTNTRVRTRVQKSWAVAK